VARVTACSISAQTSNRRPFEGQRAQDFPPRLDQIQIGCVFRLEDKLSARVRQLQQQHVQNAMDVEVHRGIDPLDSAVDPAVNPNRKSIQLAVVRLSEVAGECLSRGRLEGPGAASPFGRVRCPFDSSKRLTWIMATASGAVSSSHRTASRAPGSTGSWCDREAGYSVLNARSMQRLLRRIGCGLVRNTNRSSQWRPSTLPCAQRTRAASAFASCAVSGWLPFQTSPSFSGCSTKGDAPE